MFLLWVGAWCWLPLGCARQPYRRDRVRAVWRVGNSAGTCTRRKSLDAVDTPRAVLGTAGRALHGAQASQECCLHVGVLAAASRGPGYTLTSRSLFSAPRASPLQVSTSWPRPCAGWADLGSLPARLRAWVRGRVGRWGLACWLPCGLGLGPCLPSPPAAWAWLCRALPVGRVLGWLTPGMLLQWWCQRQATIWAWGGGSPGCSSSTCTCFHRAA